MARREWKARSGRCAVCRRRGPVVFHHVVTEHHVRDEGGDPWDFRNAMPIGAPVIGRCFCHANHHHYSHLIPLRAVPPAAYRFAVDLLGEDRAAAYFMRYYDTTEEGSHAA